MAERSSIVSLASWLGRSIGSSGALFEAFSTEFLGVDMPSSVLSDSDFQYALSSSKVAAEDLEKATDELATAGLTGSPLEITTKIVVLGNALRVYFLSIESLIDALNTAISPASIPDAQQRAVADAFRAEFKKRLVDYVVITTAEFLSPQLLFLLKILGLIDWGHTPVVGADGLSNDYVKKELRLHRFKDLIQDPGAHFNNTIGWGTDTFDPSVFFEIFTAFMRREEAYSFEEVDGDPVLTYGSVKIRRLSSVSPTALQVELDATLEETETIRRTLNKTLGLTFSSTFAIDGGATLLIAPPFDVSIRPNNGELSGRLKLFIDRHEFARPFNVIDVGLFELSVDNTSFGVSLDASWNPESGEADINPMVFVDISKGIIKLNTSDGDSFVSNLLSDADINGNFDLSFEWSGIDGLRIKASGGIEILLPIHIDLGVAEINSLYVALTIEDSGIMSLETSAGFAGNLGPLSATVERIGVVTELALTESNEADFGIFDLDLGFKPPNGVGLAIDAGVVSGGGYLYLDFDRGEYAGALELSFAAFLTLKVIGIITTKMPDGSKGFSLLLIITAEFASPIQLSFGFTLNGVGGLLGLNRTMRLEPLAQGVRTGAVQSVMFPTNVIENAPRIISDLQTFFPAMRGIFLIGPMAKVGWGAPSLVTLSLGIIIEIPGNIAILGVLKVVLPDEAAALVIIQVNFIGALEFDKKRAWIFAGLFESRVLFLTLEGEMGVLLAWGDNANFVISVGGFHPAFNPPPLPFPEPKRIAINILNTSFAKIRVDAYLAVTSNTAQFGARAELYFGMSAFKVEGHLVFDALFRFSPFYLIITISASLSVKVFGIGLWSVRIRGSLEGPTPWHVEGTGSISLLFWDIDVDFSHTWGQEAETTLPPLEVMPLLKAEYEKIENWKAEVPDASSISVSLRKTEATEDLILHPVGTLEISQRAVPLDLTIDKVGAQKPTDANSFKLSLDTGEGDLEEVEKAKEMFARAQFQNMADSKKLSSPAFESLTGGVKVSAKGEQIKTSTAVKRIVRYEQIIIDTNFKRFVTLFFNPVGILFKLFLNGNATTKSTLSNKYKKQKLPFDDKIALVPTGYGVAYTADNAPLSDEAKAFASYAQAEDYMNKKLKDNPALHDTLHVIPEVEMERVA